MGLRVNLQAILEGITPNVYFQPPPSIQMSYPCIVYNRDFIDAQFSDNIPYRREVRYQVTIIDRDPDSLIPTAVGKLPKSAYVRSFVADKLNHDVFSVYF